ncbi:MAG: ATP-binding protein [Myxococcota bacterium]|nr:ATP-binding protein [Myxococcota bacterium]
MPAGRILMVTGTESLLNLTQPLSERHYTVETASGVREALHRISEKSFEVVVSDLQFEDGDGIKLIGHIKDLTPNTEVIVLTETGSVQTAVEAIRAGAYDFIKAPLPVDALCTVIQRAQEHRKLRVSSALFQTSQAIFATQEPEALPQVVVEVAMKVMRSDDASLMLPDEGNNLRIAYSHALSPDQSATSGTIVRGGVASKIVQDRAPALLSGRLNNDPRFPDGEGSNRVRSSIVYPLWSGKKLVGVLNLNRGADTRPFHAGDLETAGVLAAQAVLALENARLVRELRSRITLLEEAQTRLIHSERLAAIGQMAAGVVHEINNPTSYLLANLVHVREGLETITPVLTDTANTTVTNAIQDWSGTNPRAAVEDLISAIVDAEDGAKRIRDIANDLRVLSRTDPGEHSKIEIEEVLRSSLRLARLSMGHGVEWRTEFADQMPVLGNARRLSQVFVNLLVNAAQAARMTESQEPWVLLSARQEGNRALIDVHNRGPGIPPDIRDRIFEPFFTTKSDEEGTGLGLAISRDIVKRHQGDIRCASCPVSGTTFTVELPLAPMVG